MASPLSVCTEEEQRAVIRFLWAEGVPGAEIHRRLSAQYGNSVLPRRSVYEWLVKFKNGRSSIKHSKGGGRPQTSTTDDNIEYVRTMILTNGRVTIDEVASLMDISHGSAYEIIKKAKETPIKNRLTS